MDEYNKIVGERLLHIRSIFNEGTKLSANQFAHLLGTTRDKITNYENGRSAVPLSLLYSLYLRGINPIYIISGEGSIYADNNAGSILKSRIENTQINEIPKSNIFYLDDDKYLNKNKTYKVAAGRIKK